MLRSIRLPLLASVVALAFIACGGGGGGGNPIPDGGQQDGSHIQFDAQKDGVIQQQDAQGDGGGGTTCNSAGGKATDGLCKYTSDCACPGHCTSIFSDTTIAGSCNPACASSTECTGSGEECIGMPDGQGVCVATGTLTGTGLTSIPLVDTPALPFTGTANVILAVDDINVTFSVGYARKSTNGQYYFVYVMPGTADTPDETKQLLIVCDSTDWSAKAYDLNTGNCQVQYAALTFNQSTGALTNWTDMAFVISGTMTLTAAPTTTGQPVQGTFTNAVPFKLVQEECGNSSTPC